MKTLSRELGQRMWGGGGTVVGSGSSEGGGESGVSAAWVNQNFLTNEFFNQLFVVHINTRVLVEDTSTTPATVISDTTTAGTLLPNDLIPSESTIETDPETGYVTTTTITLASIEATTNFWSSLAISALGQGSGGGGGSVLFEPLLSINASGLAAPGAAQNGMTIVWNNTTQKWEYGSAGGGGGTVTSITAGTGLSGGTITASGTIAINSTYQTYILNGETAYGWGNHATQGYATQTWVGQQGFLKSVAFGDLTSHPSTLSGYGITDAVSNATTWWGRSVNNNVVVGNIDMNNGDAINFKNSGGTLKSVLTLNQNNILIIGYGTNNSDYATQLRGAGISFYTYNNSAELNVGEFSKSGRFWIKQATQGLRIGDGLLTWDASNNSLKVSDASGNAANLYALGGISALGFSSGSGSTAIDSLTVNSDIYVKDYADNSLKALSVTKATSATTVNYLNIGETWSALYHDTRIYGYNVQLVSGNGAYITSMNGSGKVTFPNYIQASRFYLDSSRYIYLSGSSLYYYNGSTSIQIA